MENNSLREKIEDNVEVITESGCWIWKLSVLTTKLPYGRIVINRKAYLAHRISYQEYVGEIPNGMLVCHKCDVPSCVNPDHLFLGTHQDNTRDCVQKGRFSGWNNSPFLDRAKLNPEAVKVIKYALKYMDITQDRIAEIYRISQSTVSQIHRGIIWKDVQLKLLEGK